MAEDAISGEDFVPDRFQIRDLQRHNGDVLAYWTARIVLNGRSWTISSKHGSFIVEVGDKMYEPEGVFGRLTGQRIKFSLATKIAPMERKIREALKT